MIVTAQVATELSSKQGGSALASKSARLRFDGLKTRKRLNSWRIRQIRIANRPEQSHMIVTAQVMAELASRQAGTALDPNLTKAFGRIGDANTIEFKETLAHWDRESS